MDEVDSHWDEARVLALIENKTQESLTLDYKRSPSLDRTDSKRAELSKDVSAFANSAGGTLIYGMEEDGHLPTKMDGGYDPATITKEWLEDVLTSWIHPCVESVRITQVTLSEESAGRVAYVIDVPQARTFAPHQAADHRYYKRFNFKSVPMEDYEVRDLLRRATTPDLRCRLLVNASNGYDPHLPYDSAPLSYAGDISHSAPVGLRLAVENLSRAPATYALFTIECPVVLLNSVHSINMRYRIVPPAIPGDPHSALLLIREYGIPRDLPLWSGETWLLEDATFGISVPRQYALQGGEWPIIVTASAPGMRREKRFRLFCQDFGLHLRADQK